jgi:hypothetical protein
MGASGCCPALRLATKNAGRTESQRLELSDKLLCLNPRPFHTSGFRCSCPQTGIRCSSGRLDSFRNIGSVDRSQTPPEFARHRILYSRSLGRVERVRHHPMRCIAPHSVRFFWNRFVRWSSCPRTGSLGNTSSAFGPHNIDWVNKSRPQDRRLERRCMACSLERASDHLGDRSHLDPIRCSRK